MSKKAEKTVKNLKKPGKSQQYQKAWEKNQKCQKTG